MMKNTLAALIALSVAGTASAFGNLEYRLNHMPNRDRLPYLTKVLTAMGLTCDVTAAYDMGTLNGDQIYTISCGPDATEGALILNTTQLPIQVASCDPKTLPEEVACFAPIRVNERYKI